MCEVQSKKKMFKAALLIICLTKLTESSPIGLQMLFSQDHRQYNYAMKINVSSGTMSPSYSDSGWTLEARLTVLVYDNFTKVRYTLEDLKTSSYSQNLGYSTYQSEEAAKFLRAPWEVDYQENGFVNSIYIGMEPVWATNIKRAISINFQLRQRTGTYTKDEPCLYDACVMTYIVNGNKIKKYNSLRLTYATERRWSSVPDIWTPDYITDTITAAEREYEFNENGMMSLELKGSFQYKTHNHILYVHSELSLYYDDDTPVQSVEKLDLAQASIQYVAHDFNDPSNSIRNRTQAELKVKANEILLKISKKGIDASTVVTNASVIHSLDFIELLNTMSQLTYESLGKLFQEMVLGTSYDVETSRNIFLEVLPHVRTNACARFVKHLVMVEKDKLEDGTILSLIRKLPFNIASHSQELLEELEVITKLGLDFDQETRHAGILSFATLVYKAMEARRVKQDYFDNIVVKYFRMYSSCPQYIDRLIWLQGLCNMGYSAEAYTRTIYGDNARERHERLWSVLAGGQSMAQPYTVLETTLPIVMDDSEHIHLRLAALHTFLGTDMHASDFIYVHNYIKNSNNNQLKRFWYTTVKSLEAYKLYNGYRAASYFVPFIANQVVNPDSTYWATNNYIVTTQDEHPAALQMLSIGDSLTSLPTLVGFKMSTGGRRPHHVAIYVLAEGLSTNAMFLKNLPSSNPDVLNTDRLFELLNQLRVESIDPEKVHVDLVIQIHDKTVYATHFNQTRFENFNWDNLKRSMQDFLRFGSHINQQIVYYPLQRDINIPTELGTPIRLQSTVMSFTSLRGNLTASPAPTNMTWRNDMNLRYQGTVVTSLSTDGPLLQSEHTALIQQSIVGYLTLKIDVIFMPRAIEIHWPNPGLHHGSLAMHSRSQIMLSSPKGRDVYTVRKGKDETEVNETAIFFDCEQPMSGAQVFEELLASKKSSYEVLTSFKPSLVLLNGILLLARPSSGPCGVILPPRWMMKTNEHLVMEARLAFKEWVYLPSSLMKLKLEHSLILRNQSDNTIFLNITGGTELKQHAYDQILGVLVRGQQSSATDPSRRKWEMLMLKNDTSRMTLDQEISNGVAASEGFISVNLTLGDGTLQPTQLLLVQYRGIPRNVGGVLERKFEVKVVPNLGLFETIIDRRAALSQLLNYLQETLNITAIIKDKDGVATLSINNGPEREFDSENLAWFVDQWDNLHFLKKFGLVRECRLQMSTVQTLFGATDWLPPTDCPMTLVVGDCTASPRFGVFQLKDGGVLVYTGGYHVAVSWHEGQPCVHPMNDTTTCTNVNTWNYSVAILEDAIALVCQLTSVVVVHYRDHTTAVFLPYYYISTACGACLGQRPNLC